MSYQFAKIIFNLYVIGSTIFGAYLLSKIMNRRLPDKETVLKKIKYQNMKIRDVFITIELENQFKVAGFPLSMNAKRFQVIRYFVCTIALVYGVYKFFAFPELDAMPRLMGILIPILILTVITNPKQKSMKFLFKMYQDRNEYIKNQELFMMYSMITDELKESKDSAINILDLIRKLRQYTPHIRTSINTGLRQSKLSIDVVMKIVGDDIGTDEAKSVCKIIASLQNVSQHNLHELISNREESYIATLRANRQKRRVRQGHIVNLIVFAPLFIYMLDILFVVMQMITTMGTNLNNLK
jgi:hypothetical protein